MTAVIGILNKTAVAIAADSAVTMGKGKKILNTANKLFTLSKHHPVGIVIYNSAYFVSIPWEVLIKEYRRKEGAKPQEYLEDYAINFIKYVKESVGLISDGNRKASVCSTAGKFFQSLYKETSDKINAEFKSISQSERTADKAIELAHYYLPEVIKNKSDKYSDAKAIEDVDLDNYKIEEFLEFYGEELSRTWDQAMGNLQPTDTMRNEAYKVLHLYFKTDDFGLSSWSGIGIIGYGDKEIYPSCHMLRFAEVIGGNIRVKKEEEESFKITDEEDGAILPFAQSDVIDGFLSGIRTDLALVYTKVFSNLVDGFNKEFAEHLSNQIAKLAEGNTLDSYKLDVNKLTEKFVTAIKDVQQEKIIDPILDSIRGLSKEDLAEMAESMIHLTYLHRRINSAPESVGGPIDVAVISKGDGFIWIKRKFYFRGDINPGFLRNYFSSPM